MTSLLLVSGINVQSVYSTVTSEYRCHRSSIDQIHIIVTLFLLHLLGPAIGVFNLSIQISNFSKTMRANAASQANFTVFLQFKSNNFYWKTVKIHDNLFRNNDLRELLSEINYKIADLIIMIQLES